MVDGRANIALSVGLIFLLLIRNPDNCIRLRGQTDDLDKVSLVEKKLLNVNWDNTRDYVCSDADLQTPSWFDAQYTCRLPSLQN